MTTLLFKLSYDIGMFLMEAYICWILKKEYDYDREWNERKAARRKKINFENLTTGEMK